MCNFSAEALIMNKFLPMYLGSETITVCVSFIAHAASYCLFNLLFNFSFLFFNGARLLRKKKLSGASYNISSCQ